MIKLHITWTKSDIENLRLGVNYFFFLGDVF